MLCIFSIEVYTNDARIHRNCASRWSFFMNATLLNEWKKTRSLFMLISDFALYSSNNLSDDIPYMHSWFMSHSWWYWWDKIETVRLHFLSSLEFIEYTINVCTEYEWLDLFLYKHERNEHKINDSWTELVWLLIFFLEIQLNMN